MDVVGVTFTFNGSDVLTVASGDARYALASDFDSHVGATNNPHGVTAAQVGAVPISGGEFTGRITAKDLFIKNAGTRHVWFRRDDGTEGAVIWNSGTADELSARVTDVTGTILGQWTLDLTGFTLNMGAYGGSPVGAYGSIAVRGSTSNYAGIEFTDVTGSGGVLMVHTTLNIQGFFKAGAGWSWYFQDGVLVTGSVPWNRLTGHVAVNTGDGLTGGGSLDVGKTLSVDGSVLRTPATNLSTGADLDTILVGGYYTASGPANAPPDASAGWLYIEVAAYASNNYVMQTATRMTGAQNNRWVRKRLAGTWYPWVEIWTNDGVERGSNANGEYTKFLDGSLICWNTNFQTSAGAAARWTYPVSFSWVPTVSATLRYNNLPRVLACDVPGTGYVDVSSWDLAGSDHVYPAVSLFAVGRWK